MSTETDSVPKSAMISVAEKQSVPISQYNQLLCWALLMERKLKAMENIHYLLRQKDLELMKCRNMLQQYQTTIRKFEHRQMDSVHRITKISETKDTRGHEQTNEVEDESDQNKGFCVPADVTEMKLQKLDGTTVASDVTDGNTGLTQSPSVSIVSAECFHKDCSKASSVQDSVFQGTQCHCCSATTATKSQNCGQVTNFLDEEMDMSSGSTCLRLKSNQNKIAYRQSHPVSSTSKDLLIKLMQQNARLKKTLKDILTCKGTSVEHYLDREELKDTIVQLRQRLDESANQMAELQTKIKTLSQYGTNINV